MSRFPLRYALANLLVGRPGEYAALYRVGLVSYPLLAAAEKVRWLGRLARLGFAVEADFSLWRVNRAFPVERYTDEAAALLDRRGQDERAWLTYLAGHERELAAQRPQLPELYLAVSLPPAAAQRLSTSLLGAVDGAPRRLERLLGVAPHQPIPGSELERLTAAEERVFARVAAALGPAEVRRASTRELEWLLRRAACRGVAEPVLEDGWRPNALIVRGAGGEAAYRPLETDLLRCANQPLLEQDRCLVVDAEEGRSYQALLTFGALPDEAEFPGPRAELLCTPLEALDFPVDVALHATWIPNREAISQVRKRVMDADNIYAEQSSATHGPSWQADDNRVLARQLEDILQGEDRPPLIEACISLAIGAPSRDELERRVERTIDQYGRGFTLRRPLGLQADLFFDQLPRPGGARVNDYREVLTVEQFGALMPIGTHAAGPERGVYIGYTTAGARRPLKFDLTEASRTHRPTTILMAGSLGSGKTIAALLLACMAERRGSLVCDVDPKPDHRLHELPQLAGRIDVLELTGDERYRGMLDPLTRAPKALREDLATSYLLEILRDPPAAWETQISRAVRDAVRRRHASLGAVLDALRQSDNPDARQAAEALEVPAESGLGQLAFGTGADDQLAGAAAPVTTIRAPGLTLPAPTAVPGDYSRAERLSVATLKLVAARAMRLVSGDRSRHKLVLFDEAWFLLASSEGRRLIDRLQRLGRAENATLVLATQQLADIADTENLIGSYFIFGQETAAQARQALELLGLDPNDHELAARVRSYREGRCLFRDLDGRIAEMQIDAADPHLIDALDTSPRAHPTTQPTAA